MIKKVKKKQKLQKNSQTIFEKKSNSKVSEIFMVLMEIFIFVENHRLMIVDLKKII